MAPSCVASTTTPSICPALLLSLLGFAPLPPSAPPFFHKTLSTLQTLRSITDHRALALTPHLDQLDQLLVALYETPPPSSLATLLLTPAQASPILTVALIHQSLLEPMRLLTALSRLVTSHHHYLPALQQASKLTPSLRPAFVTCMSRQTRALDHLLSGQDSDPDYEPYAFSHVPDVASALSTTHALVFVHGLTPPPLSPSATQLLLDSPSTLAFELALAPWARSLSQRLSQQLTKQLLARNSLHALISRASRAYLLLEDPPTAALDDSVAAMLPRSLPTYQSCHALVSALRAALDTFTQLNLSLLKQGRSHRGGGASPALVQTRDICHTLTFLAHAFHHAVSTRLPSLLTELDACQAPSALYAAHLAYLDAIASSSFLHPSARPAILALIDSAQAFAKATPSAYANFVTSARYLFRLAPHPPPSLVLFSPSYLSAAGE